MMKALSEKVKEGSSRLSVWMGLSDPTPTAKFVRRNTREAWEEYMRVLMRLGDDPELIYPRNISHEWPDHSLSQPADALYTAKLMADLAPIPHENATFADVVYASGMAVEKVESALDYLDGEYQQDVEQDVLAPLQAARKRAETEERTVEIDRGDKQEEHDDG